MLIWFLFSLASGIDAGPARVSCGGFPVTLTATPLDAPANFEIQWEDNIEPGPFLVVTPAMTTTYRVFLTNLDTNEVFEDTTTVFVHPISADIVPDNQFNLTDQLAWFANWSGLAQDQLADADQDGSVTILDWFYLCNYDLNPVNTPPRLTVSYASTFENETVIIPVSVEDDEQTPSLSVNPIPSNGSAFFLSGQLRYSPSPDFVGTDTFGVTADDGTFTLPPKIITVTVARADRWDDIFNDIFVPECQACHIDAVSGGLSLATYEATQAGGVSGAGFIPGEPNLSSIYLRLLDGSMPVDRPPLSAEEVERIGTWIRRGAQNTR